MMPEIKIEQVELRVQKIRPPKHISLVVAPAVAQHEAAVRPSRGRYNPALKPYSIGSLELDRLVCEAKLVGPYFHGEHFGRVEQDIASIPAQTDERQGAEDE